MERLTYKSQYGDYGSEKEYSSTSEEICALRNSLGKYEDTGMTPEEIEKYKRVDSNPDNLIVEFTVMKKLKELFDHGELVRRSNEDKIKSFSVSDLIKSLECCVSDGCRSCPAFAPDMRDSCMNNIMAEAAERLKEKR